MFIFWFSLHVWVIAVPIFYSPFNHKRFKSFMVGNSFADKDCPRGIEWNNSNQSGKTREMPPSGFGALSRRTGRKVSRPSNTIIQIAYDLHTIH